ncbi:MAG TPA: efflux RND transporter periplasmic adaptor subunit [Gemmataceae bacterium]|nr:efflux RND transporter periplasmic adaptor subunit [Gemmataceae bacterium]
MATADNRRSETQHVTAPNAAVPMPKEAPEAGVAQPQPDNAKGQSASSPPPKEVTKAKPMPIIGRKTLRWGAVALAVAVAAYFLVPWITVMLTTVSTDDAYVNSHVTFVAARVPGQVKEVRVDDNNRVKKGDVLVQLDKEPYQVKVAIKKALVETAATDLTAAEAQVQGLLAQARSNRFKLEHAIENVNNQIANLNAAAATLASKQATLNLAKDNFKRGEDLMPKGTISKEEFDQRKEAVKVAEAAVEQNLQQIYAIRVGLGLPAQPAEGKELTDVPADLDQNFSTVRQALADLAQSTTQFGYFPASWTATPKEVIAAFYKQDPKGDLNRIFEALIPNAPAIKQAKAKLLQAQRDLEQAELDLRYCDIVSEIDGVVTRRNVNPGNNITAGQSLMAVRSLTEIWIDANFKETQLADLRIGQRVKIEVDMYGRRKEYEGRITGFTMGTGQTLALLPPQNATGNFVKIVQRLPVRIELTDYDPETMPLFVGLSVTPYVYFTEPPTGPHAGEMLQPQKKEMKDER